MILLYIWLVVVIVAVVRYYRRVQARFAQNGIKFFKPVPFLGNMALVALKKEHYVENLNKLYNAFPKERFFGKFEFLRYAGPAIVIRDVELVKKVTVKDFEHFVDHGIQIDKKGDPLFANSLFFMTGQEWKDMRSTLSPAFTSSKIKQMVPFIVEVCNNMNTALNKKIKNSGTGYVDVETKDLMSRLANDVIATCAFGLVVDSHNDEGNSFYKMGKIATEFKIGQIVTMIFVRVFPNLAKMLNISTPVNPSRSFFKDLILSTMKDREVRNFHRPDMIHLLMEAKKGKLQYEEKNTDKGDVGFATVEESDIGKSIVNREWTDDHLVAQAMLFFIAGFETVSSAMSFMLHELALNPDIQEKLYKEIKETDAKNSGKFDYSSIQSMSYLDMVLTETLRLWPSAQSLDRLCTKDYNLGKPNENSTKDYILRKGEVIQIPVWSFQHDPHYFPNPAKFDPERFSEENKHKINPFAYIPFGSGPRNCIGSRFALCEVKVMIYHLLKVMEVSAAPNTQVKPILSKENIHLRLEGGNWIRLSLRR